MGGYITARASDDVDLVRFSFDREQHAILKALDLLKRDVLVDRLGWGRGIRDEGQESDPPQEENDDRTCPPSSIHQTSPQFEQQQARPWQTASDHFRSDVLLGCDEFVYRSVALA